MPRRQKRRFAASGGAATAAKIIVPKMIAGLARFLVLATVIACVLAARTLLFEYTHGDPRMVHQVLDALLT